MLEVVLQADPQLPCSVQKCAALSFLHCVRNEGEARIANLQDIDK